MKEKGISNKVTEAWALEDFYMKVNGVEVCDIDFVGYEAIYGGCNIPAEVQFIDTKGLLTGDNNDIGNVGIGGFVEIGFTTANNCDFKDEYVITKVDTVNNSKNQKLVSLKLEDTETRNMKGSFVSKGYPNKKFSEVIEDHSKEIKNDTHQKTRKMEVVPPEDEKKSNIVIPSHINFYDFLNLEMKDKGFQYIKDKTTSSLVHVSNKLFDKLSNLGDVYEYDTNPFSFTRIVQFNIEGFDSDAYLDSIPTSITSIDNVTNNSEDYKEGVDSKISKKDPKKEVKTEVSGSKVTEGMTDYRGKKQGTKTLKDKQYFETISNAQKCSIWVPGRVDNMIGRKIKTVFPKPSYYSGTDSDKLFTGEWEVYMVRDKIIGMYFMQELFLRRPGGGEK